MEVPCSSDNKCNYEDTKTKLFWKSFFDLETFPSIELNEYWDVSLLLNTLLLIYKKANKKLRETDDGFKTVLNELEISKNEIKTLKKELERSKSACENCSLLEKEVNIYRKKLEDHESRIKSIASILDLNSACKEEGTEGSTNKAYNLVSQLLLGRTDIPDDSQEMISQKCSRKSVRKKPESRITQSENLEIVSDLTSQDPAESQKVIHTADAKNIVIPETLYTLFPVEEKEITSQYEDKEKASRTPPRPLKRCRTEASSPVLSGTPKLSAVKSVRKLLATDSPENSRTIHLSAINQQPTGIRGALDENPPFEGKDNECDDMNHMAKSESLIKCKNKSELGKLQSTINSAESLGLPEIRSVSNVEILSSITSDKNLPVNTVIHPPGDSKDVEYIGTYFEREESIRDDNKHKIKSPNKGKKKADFWKLKAGHYVDKNLGISENDKKNCKFKQTKLSLGCFAKKTDVGSLEEFNAGIRKTSTQYSVKITESTDDELLQKAIEESLKYSGSSQQCPSEDEDIVFESPNALPSKKIQASGLEGIKRCNDTDITVFVPRNDTCLPDDLHELDGEIKKTSPKIEGIEKLDPCKDTSFDRLPPKVNTSPNYKYRRNPIRNKKLRQQLEGWECDHCKKYFGTEEMNSADAKNHMNHCSRHRDKYPVRASTPPGFWDPDFPNTQECRRKMLDITQKNNSSKVKKVRR